MGIPIDQYVKITGDTNVKAEEKATYGGGKVKCYKCVVCNEISEPLTVICSLCINRGLIWAAQQAKQLDGEVMAKPKVCTTKPGLTTVPSINNLVRINE